MPQYRYRAIDHQGRATRGARHAESAAALEQALDREGFCLVHAERHDGAASWLGRRRIRRREVIEFCVQLEQLTAAGIPLIDGLRDLRDGAEGTAFARVMAELIEAVEAGRNFSEALAAQSAVFDDVFAGLVRAGEHAGKLPETLATLAAQLRWEEDIAARTRTLLQYPLFVAAVLIALIAFLLGYLVPQLATFMRGLGHELPLQTRVLLWLSDACVRHGWSLLLALAALASALVFAFRRSPWLRDGADRIALTLPVFGPILRKILLQRFASGFAMMYGAGILVLDALRYLEAAAGNRALRDALQDAGAQVAQGRSLAAAFADSGFFPPLVVRMVQTGERTGALDTALRNVSSFYNREVRDGVERLQGLVEPLLTVALGAVLAGVMLAVLGPVYDTIAGVRL